MRCHHVIIAQEPPARHLHHLIHFTGEEPQPHLHLVLQTDTFNLNLCTIMIDWYGAIITQEPPAPARHLHHLIHDMIQHI